MHDIILRGGTIYDGTGHNAFAGDVAIDGQHIAAMERRIVQNAHMEIDVAGMAVAPGFINMLSWANESLIADGRSLSDIKQGITLEIMGEGTSMGPLTEQLRRDRETRQGDIKYDVTWTTLAEYLDHL